MCMIYLDHTVSTSHRCSVKEALIHVKSLHYKGTKSKQSQIYTKLCLPQRQFNFCVRHNFYHRNTTALKLKARNPPSEASIQSKGRGSFYHPSTWLQRCYHSPPPPASVHSEIESPASPFSPKNEKKAFLNQSDLATCPAPSHVVYCPND